MEFPRQWEQLRQTDEKLECGSLGWAQLQAEGKPK